MQTFLPYPDFARSAAALDPARLGKQRVEALQVLRALELEDYGWRHHPAVRMWRGRTPALVAYGLTCVAAWTGAGRADGTGGLIAEFAPEVVGRGQPELAERGLLPGWLGDAALHRSHRSALLRKDPQHYRPLFGEDPADLPYVWPDPDPDPGPDPVRPVDVGGEPAWVLRVEGDAALHAALAAGEVALAATAPGGRRSPKWQRQVTAFLTAMAPGDVVAVPVRAGTALLLGEVLGGACTTADGERHVRRVRWAGERPRSAVLPPARMQDPRTLFRVRLAPG